MNNAPTPSQRTVQLAIAREIRSSIVVAAPNYTPANWWECDLWAVTKAGYACEYEIKFTAQDFKADTTKRREVYGTEWIGNRLERTYERKHDMLAQKNTEGPSRFFFVVPAELRDQVEPKVPAWAGLGLFRGHRVRFVKDAPVLHRVKVKRREIMVCQRRMWFRYWNAIEQIERARLGVPA